MRRLSTGSVLALVALSGSLYAPIAESQSLAVSLPRDSQRAVVSQRLGVTDVTITYHRPLVKGRKIWGSLVPFGEVWRAGANENTTFEVTDPVTIEGQPLAKGTYGLHAIPTADSWTLIFSRNATSWGSYSYDKGEDALRVTVKPVASEHKEALAYEFDDVKPGSAVVSLRWEKLAVPFRVAVDLNEAAVARFKQDLRGLAKFSWDGYNDAAAWCLQNKTHLDDALAWADESIKVEERFDNLSTKAEILNALGKTAEADVLMKKALPRANAGQLHNYGRQLLTQKKKKEALEVFEMNARKNPDVWFTAAGLARAQSANGDFKAAATNMKLALAKAPKEQRARIEEFVKKLEAGQDINN